MMNSKDLQKIELRLQGAQVHLNYRLNNHKNERKNKICDRPRSALNNSTSRYTFTETHRRPFSAGTKPPSPKFNQFLRHATKANLSNPDWNYRREHQNTVRSLSPSTLFLNNHKRLIVKPSYCIISDDISEQGSEDTLVSLGSRIKARARARRASNRGHSSYTKSTLAFGEVPCFLSGNRSHYKAKVDISDNKRPTMEEELHSDDSLNDSDSKEEQALRYTDKFNAPIPKHSQTHHQTIHTDYYYDEVDQYSNKGNSSQNQNNALAGRVSFGQHQPYDITDIGNVDPFAKKNYLNLPQLSLVEEESILELDSLSSSGSVKSKAQGTSRSKSGNKVKDTSMLASKVTTDQSDKYINSRKESGTFILETSDFTNLWKNDDKTQSTPRMSYMPYQTENNSTQIQSQMDLEQKISDTSKIFSSTLSSDVMQHRKSESLENYSLKDVNTLFESPGSTFTQLANTKLELESDLKRNSELERHLSLESFSLENNTETEPAVSVTKKHCSWNKSKVNDIEAKIEKRNTNENKNIDGVTKIIEHTANNEGLMSDSVPDSAGSYTSYMKNNLTKAHTICVIEDYKKEIEAINNLHELTLKDLELDTQPQRTVLHIAHESHTTKRCDAKSFIPTNIAVNYSNGVGRLDVCNIPTEELIQNYFDAKEDGGKKFRPNYKLVPRKKTGGNKLNNGTLNVSDTSVKVRKTFVESTAIHNNLAKARKTCFSAPNLKSTEGKTNYQTQPLSARIECIQNDKDIESWISTQIITPRVETSLDADKTITNPYNKIKEVTVENNPDSEKKETANTKPTQEENITTSKVSNNVSVKVKELSENSTVLDIYSMLKEIERYGEKPGNGDGGDSAAIAGSASAPEEDVPKDNFQEIFTFLEKVEDSANEALLAVSPSAPITVPKLESLLRLSHTELAQRVITAALQLEERSCCITLLQESLATHKEQTMARVTALEKQSSKNISKVKQDCEEVIKRHQTFIDQLINDKKSLNHRIEQLVDERRAMEEKARRQAHTLEERFKVELRTQHDKMSAAQQLARQRWVKQKAEKIKELTVKGLEGELRDMADRQQREVASMRLLHAEEVGRLQVQHEEHLRQVRETLQQENECALIKERQICSARLEKQILEIELTYQEQRTRLVSEMRAENEKAVSQAAQRDVQARQEIGKLRTEQEKELSERHAQLETEMAKQKMQITEELEKQREKLEEEFAEYKRSVEAEHQVLLKKRIHEVTLQHKQERDREIEKAIDSMELEAQKGKKELHDALRRNKEQYECELRELAETERVTLQRHRDAQARAREAEDKCGNLEITKSQLESKLRIAEENILQCQQRLLDMQKLTESKWRGKYDELRAESDKMKTSHEEQMQQLYAKVKVAVARKDTAITALTRDNTKALEKISLLEQRLQQQRKDFLRQK